MAGASCRGVMPRPGGSGRPAAAPSPPPGAGGGRGRSSLRSPPWRRPSSGEGWCGSRTRRRTGASCRSPGTGRLERRYQPTTMKEKEVNSGKFPPNFQYVSVASSPCQFSNESRVSLSYLSALSLLRSSQCKILKFRLVFCFLFSRNLSVSIRFFLQNACNFPK